MQNILYKKNRIILFAEYENPQLHKHFSKHILVSNKPFVCLIEDKQYNVNSMIIQSQVVHSVKKDMNSRMVVFLIDETSSLSKLINKEYLHGRDRNQFLDRIEKDIIQLIDGGYSLDAIDKYVMAQLHYEELDNSFLDDRILYSIRYIEACESLNNEIYDILPKKTFLSKSRFLHLFKDEVAIDLKNYLLLKKMEKAYDYVIKKDMNITEAAILSGFSSPSHFSKTCKKHYGISLTDFLKAQKI